MYVLILYTALALNIQPYYWLSIIVVTVPPISFILYAIFKPPTRRDFQANVEFSYKAAPILGFLGFINYILVGFSAAPNRSPPDFQAIASQLTVPVTVIFSVILIRRFPNALQTLAALVVMGGVAVSIVPGLDNPSFAGSPFWMICFVIGNVVQGPQAIIMEHSMKHRESKQVVVDGFFASGVSGLWSALFFFAALPLNFWPWFSQTDEQQFWRLMKGAWDCTVHGTDPAHPSDSAACHNLWLVLTLLVLVVALWNAICAYMEAKFTANYTQIANTLGGVIATFYYNIQAIAGAVYEPFSWFNVLAVVMILGGTVAFRYFEKHEEYVEVGKTTPIDFLMIKNRTNDDTHIATNYNL
jgi:drug/metabolite transporter (DMT)-like permease